METNRKVKAEKVGEVLYIDEPRKSFVPSYVYYLLEAHECTKVCFKGSSKMYNKEDLKSKNEWKGI